MRPVTASVGPLAAANATNIRTASAIAGAGAVTLNGTLVSAGATVAFGVLQPSGTFVMDQPRQVLFTSAGNDSGITFTITGQLWSGASATETVTGANASTAASVLSFKTGTITASGASAGNVSIGTNGVAASPWVKLDAWAPPQTAIQCTASGTVNYTVQSTLDDPNDPSNPVAPASMTWVNSSDTAAVGATGTIQTNFAFAPKYVRVLLNSGTGTVTMTATQTSAPP